MLESTRIIHRPWVDALAAIVRTASASLMAIHPRAKGFQPRIPRAPIAFVQDHDPDPPPLKILSSGHVFPLPLDDTQPSFTPLRTWHQPAFPDVQVRLSRHRGPRRRFRNSYAIPADWTSDFPQNGV